LDVDVLSEESNKLFEKGELDIFPPVTGAVAYILNKENIDLVGKKVVVVGLGALVGKPSLAWFKGKTADVIAVDKNTENISLYTKDADIILSGVGIPNLIKPQMVKDGVILLDAGTSEDSGELKGDISKECIGKAKLLTPVPGGIGPITVSVLLENVAKNLS
jgi:methylenetetrahydrofolate dehydrogenase (NADP+)/methenyltetrahydrofolate cyclohydrolase